MLIPLITLIENATALAINGNESFIAVGNELGAVMLYSFPLGSSRGKYETTNDSGSDTKGPVIFQ